MRNITLLLANSNFMLNLSYCLAYNVLKQVQVKLICFSEITYSVLF